MVDKPWEWRWSSAQAHLNGRDDGLLDMVRWRAEHTPESWKLCLEHGLADGQMLREIRESTERGWPLGDDAFLDRIEQQYGVRVRPAKRGRRAKDAKPAATATSTKIAAGAA